MNAMASTRAKMAALASTLIGDSFAVVRTLGRATPVNKTLMSAQNLPAPTSAVKMALPATTPQEATGMTFDY